MSRIQQTVNGRTVIVETEQRVSMIGQDDQGYSWVKLTQRPERYVPMPETPWLRVEPGFIGRIIADGWVRDFDGTEAGR